MGSSIENDLKFIELSLKEGNFNQISNDHLVSLFTLCNVCKNNFIYFNFVLILNNVFFFYNKSMSH